MVKQFLIPVMLVIAFGCQEESAEEKRKTIQKNKLENEALRKEIKADSLKRKSESLEERAKNIEQEAKEYRDSAKRM